MKWTIKIVRTSMLLLSLNLSQYPPEAMESKRIQAFRALGGREQVHMLLHETSIFRKAFTTDFQIEEEILVASTDATVDSFLAAEARYGDTGTAQEAVFILCERARFFHSREFPLKVPLDGFVTGIQGGLINPFLADFDRMGREAGEAVKEALNGSRAKVRTTARVYCGGLEQELAAISANELVARWRAELGKLPNPIFADSDSSETGELVRVLKRALAARGLESATAMSQLLERETKPWARENEIEMIEFLDGAAVRLRGSQQGRDVLQIVENTLANKQLRVYKNTKERQEYWKLLQDVFFKDQYTNPGTDRDHWARLIGLAFDQYYGEDVLISHGGRRPSFARANEFMIYLTNIDPSFPSWEFASTLSEEDMFHPRFAAKMARYHALWVQMNASHEK
jgi:hypothetical protein